MIGICAAHFDSLDRAVSLIQQRMIINLPQGKEKMWTNNLKQFYYHHYANVGLWTPEERYDVAARFGNYRLLKYRHS